MDYCGDNVNLAANWKKGYCRQWVVQKDYASQGKDSWLCKHGAGILLLR